MAPPESWGLQLGDCIAGMSEDSRGLLTRTQHLADCTIRTSDGLDFRLHKMKLTEESMVLGSMLVDWRADCSAIEVSEDGASFAQLVDAMYARGMKEQALSADCIDKLSELQRKYKMENLHESCSLFISNISLTIDNLSRWHILASNFGFENAIEHCRKFVESGLFDAIRRNRPSWISGLEPRKAVQILEARLDRILKVCASHDDSFRILNMFTKCQRCERMNYCKNHKAPVCAACLLPWRES